MYSFHVKIAVSDDVIVLVYITGFGLEATVLANIRK